MPPRRPASLKVWALQWLAQREHSRAELRDKLLRLLASTRRDDDIAQPRAAASADTAAAAMADPETEVDALLAWLEQRGYLSDARFVQVRVQARQNRYGNQRLRQELRQRGVAIDPATEAELAGSEFARACAVWQRRYDTPATDAAGRLRQMRFLVGRGFSMDVVQRVLRQAADGGMQAPDADAG